MQPQETKVRTQSRARPTVRPAQLFVLLAAWLFVPWKVVAQNTETTGQVQETVFVLDSTGRAYVASATVMLNGPTTLQTESDEEGRFMFAEVPPGTYTIEATSPGLEAMRVVSVEMGSAAQVSLELKPSAVRDSVTVTAPENETTTPFPSEIITSTVVRDAPNKNERADSILPLIPGVVRGPDGRINLKGARNTQSGALVNSANVTDPATGSPGIDLPIDVVASVQVISNPYDPQYGKLTGAVSTLDTKTGDYEKFHVSVQNLMPRARVRGGSVSGVGAATPRVTLTGPIKKDRLAFTQSLEYRFIRTPVNSLPSSQRDTTLESVNSYTQLDAIFSSKQTATITLAVYPQKLKYLGLNTFTPHEWADGTTDAGPFVACTNAIRWLIVQNRIAQANKSAVPVDSTTILQQVQRIRTSLECVKTMNRKVSDVWASANDIQTEAESLRDEVRAILTVVEDALRATAPTEKKTLLSVAG